MNFKNIEEYLKKPFSYSESNCYMGYDPFDSLTSRFYDKISKMSKNSFVKLACSQCFQRLLFNFRHFLSKDKEFSPKAVGSFLSSFCNFYLGKIKLEHLEKFVYFSDLVFKMQNTANSESCWGYSFERQPCVVFQESYKITNDDKFLSMARNDFYFILKKTNKTYDNQNFGFSFSYFPLGFSVVYNGSSLGFRLLSNVNRYTQKYKFLKDCKKVLFIACQNQQSNVFLSYFGYDFHKWIDNLHNLESTFFTDEENLKYFKSSMNPINMHLPAQFILTLHKLDKFVVNKELLQKISIWKITFIKSLQVGYFYCQINRFFTSKIAYVRWSQA